jgi:hypothetical protein
VSATVSPEVRRKYARHPQGPGVYRVARRKDGQEVGHVVQNSRYNREWHVWTHTWVGVATHGEEPHYFDRRFALEAAIEDVIAAVEAHAKVEVN